MTETAPTTTAGAAAMLAYLAKSTKSVETDWHEAVAETLVAALVWQEPSPTAAGGGGSPIELIACSDVPVLRVK